MARFALQNVKKTGMLGALLEDEVGKICSTLRRELGFTQKTEGIGAAPNLCGRITIASKLCANVDRFGCDKTLGTAACRKASVVLRRFWQAGLQLDVAKRIATAARKVALDHSATIVLCGIAAGGC